MNIIKLLTYEQIGSGCLLRSWQQWQSQSCDSNRIEIFIGSKNVSNAYREESLTYWMARSSYIRSGHEHFLIAVCVNLLEFFGDFCNFHLISHISFVSHVLEAIASSFFLRFSSGEH